MTEENTDVFEGFGIEVNLGSDFTKVREVLTRIGIANYKTKTITQSCHIFHKRGRYAIMHFKEMFQFDKKDADLSPEDEARRNRIVKMLEEWGLIKLVDEIDYEHEGIAPVHSVNVIPRKVVKEENWKLVKKYTLGKK